MDENLRIRWLDHMESRFYYIANSSVGNSKVEVMETRAPGDGNGVEGDGNKKEKNSTSHLRHTMYLDSQN